MKGPADIYRAEILRAVLGPAANELRADDIARLNTYAERLADSEAALAAMQARGYGRGAASLTEAVSQVPERECRSAASNHSILKCICRPAQQQAGGLRYSPAEIARFFQMSPD